MDTQTRQGFGNWRREALSVQQERRLSFVVPYVVDDGEVKQRAGGALGGRNITAVIVAAAHLTRVYQPLH